MNRWWSEPEYIKERILFVQRNPVCIRCGRPAVTPGHSAEDYRHGFIGYLEAVKTDKCDPLCSACNLMERSNFHPCPSCVRLYHLGQKEKIRYIPEQSEVCSECRDPEDKELREREQEQFVRLIRKRREEQNERDRIARRPYLDKQNQKRREFYKMVVKRK